MEKNLFSTGNIYFQLETVYFQLEKILCQQAAINFYIEKEVHLIATDICAAATGRLPKVKCVCRWPTPGNRQPETGNSFFQPIFAILKK
jgi:EAL domain-containing protein (putative c-di-GMP-specific phosphodiesterase class I)